MANRSLEFAMLFTILRIRKWNNLKNISKNMKKVFDNHFEVCIMKFKRRRFHSGSGSAFYRLF